MGIGMLLSAFLPALQDAWNSYRQSWSKPPPPEEDEIPDWKRFNDMKYLEFLYDNGAILYMDSDQIRKKQMPSVLVMSFCAAGMAEIDSNGRTIVVTHDRNKANLLHQHLSEYYDGSRIPSGAQGQA